MLTHFINKLFLNLTYYSMMYINTEICIIIEVSFMLHGDYSAYL